MARTKLADFISAVAAVAPASGNLYQAVLNPDGITCSVIQNPNGVDTNGKVKARVVIYPSVFYSINASKGVITDANPNGDVVTIFQSASESVNTDCQQFLSSLT